MGRANGSQDSIALSRRAKTFTYVDGDDWGGIYDAAGQLLGQGHLYSEDVHNLLSMLGVHFTHVDSDAGVGDYLLSHGQLPEQISDLPGDQPETGVVLVSLGYWVGLYRDGSIHAESDHLHLFDLVRALDLELEHVYADPDWLLEVGHLPSALLEVVTL